MEFPKLLTEMSIDEIHESVFEEFIAQYGDQEITIYKNQVSNSTRINIWLMKRAVINKIPTDIEVVKVLKKTSYFKHLSGLRLATAGLMVVQFWYEQASQSNKLIDPSRLHWLIAKVALLAILK